MHALVARLGFGVESIIELVTNLIDAGKDAIQSYRGTTLSGFGCLGNCLLAHLVDDVRRQVGQWRRFYAPRLVAGRKQNIADPGFGGAALDIRDVHPDFGATELSDLTQLLRAVDAIAPAQTVEHYFFDAPLAQLGLLPGLIEVGGERRHHYAVLNLGLAILRIDRLAHHLGRDLTHHRIADREGRRDH